MAQRVPANIPRAKNLQNSKKKLSKRRHCTLKAETHRNHWPVARIIETFEDKHGVVRTVELKLGRENNAQRELV